MGRTVALLALKEQYLDGHKVKVKASKQDMANAVLTVAFYHKIQCFPKRNKAVFSN